MAENALVALQSGRPTESSLLAIGDPLNLRFGNAASQSKIQNLKSKIESVQAISEKPGGRAVLASFTTVNGSISVLLAEHKDGWTVDGEWSVERRDNGDAGSKNETQRWTIENGIVRRDVHRMNVEGIEYTLPCGCCKAIQTRTIETVEQTRFAWNAGSLTLEQQSFAKMYVVQPGEGLFSVARKALGDARLIGKILALNPELKRDAQLSAGQKIIVERN
jgi:hypothetical protein